MTKSQSKVGGRRQSGLGLPTAIFVITVMALLAVSINAVVRSNAESTGEELNLIRAFYVAESGLQFGLNNVFPPAASAETSSCPAVTAYPAFTAGGMNTCDVNVTCTEQNVDVDGDGNDESFFTITSTGMCNGVSRTVQVRAQ